MEILHSTLSPLLQSQDSISLFAKEIKLFDKIQLDLKDISYPLEEKKLNVDFSLLFNLTHELKGEQVMAIYRWSDISVNPYHSPYIKDMIIETVSVLLGQILTQINHKHQILSLYQYPQECERSSISIQNINCKLTYNMTIFHENPVPSDLILLFIKKKEHLQ